jgi:hypothetical protein
MIISNIGKKDHTAVIIAELLLVQVIKLNNVHIKILKEIIKNSILVKLLFLDIIKNPKNKDTIAVGICE